MEIGTFSKKRGDPFPFGVHTVGNSTNFSLYVQGASQVILQFFAEEEGPKVGEVSLDPIHNRSGDIWHICIENLPSPLFYLYYIRRQEVPAQRVFDPCAISLTGPVTWGTIPPNYQPRGVVFPKSDFDWEDDLPPLIPKEDLIIYEMHVRGFTQDPSSHVQHPGTFLGVIEKIPYLKELGVNAIELMPITYFNECEYNRHLHSSKLYNYWGYSPMSFLALMNRFATDSSQVLREFKEMVKALHKEGIEVYLDLVFNHTSEGGQEGPELSLKGIARDVYYMTSPTGEFLDFTGCGNTVNANHPICLELLLHALRYFIADLHVDGFRFDLASCLTRDPEGAVVTPSPIIEAIGKDPLLSKVKLIAEPWDAAGLYQVGEFPWWGLWSEWNGRFRDDVRRFLKGTPDNAGLFATRVCGSSDIYGYSSQGPTCSINFITAHDGFSLRDLVSYNHKHNDANLENNRDGFDANDSWNCGTEGESENPQIMNLRLKQMRNLTVALMTAQGIPMIPMGDEYGHTKRGNNNTWCQDNAMNWLQWTHDNKESTDFFRFFKKMIALRRQHCHFKRTLFLDEADIEWHGVMIGKPDWRASSKFIAFVLKGNDDVSFYIAFNTSEKPLKAMLPSYRKWQRLVDTSRPSPEDFLDIRDCCPLNNASYNFAPYSSVILISTP